MIEGGVLLLKFSGCEITITKPFATDINLKFKDRSVSIEEYILLNNRLDKYEWYLESEHSMASKMEYDESSGILLIGITIIIPNRLMSKDAAKIKQLIKDHEDRFQKFYERTILSFNYKKRKKLNLNHSKIALDG